MNIKPLADNVVIKATEARLTEKRENNFVMSRKNT